MGGRPRADSEIRKASVMQRMELGDRLRRRRDQLGLKQATVAQELKVTQGYLSQVEGGEQAAPPDISFWVRLCHILQLNPLPILEIVWQSRRSLQLDFGSFSVDERKLILELAIQKLPDPIVPPSTATLPIGAAGSRLGGRR